MWAGGKMMETKFTSELREWSAAITQATNMVEAAPDMLAALETTAGNLRSLIASCNCNTYDVWLAEVEAAIQKATGA